MRGALSVIFLLLSVCLLRAESGSAVPEVVVDPVPEERGVHSPVEALYAERFRGVQLRQFGYDIFSAPLPATAPVVPVDDRYLLGPGDQLVLYLWGDPVEILNLESVYTVEVDREGKIFLPYTGILHVHGKTLNELKDALRESLARKFRRFRVEVSVRKLRSFPVYVAGAVEKPGVVFAQGTHTVFDVLLMAGGIRKEGSLRRVTLTRRGSAGEEKVVVDLYDLLIYGRTIDVRVRDGDLIYVPPVGRTAGVVGAVKRPAIYELRGEVSLSELISLAGGVLPSAHSVVKILRYEEGSVKVYESTLDNLQGVTVHDGDLVIVEEVHRIVRGAVRVEGHVAYPGSYALADTKSLRELISKVKLLPDTNMHHAELIRREPPDYTPSVVPFSPISVLEGKEDIPLKDMDTVRFYPRWINPPIQVSGEVEEPVVVPYYDGVTLLDVLRDLRFTDEIVKLKAVVYRSVEGSFRDTPEGVSVSRGLPARLTLKDLVDLRLRLEEELAYVQRLRKGTDSEELEVRERELKLRLAEIERRLKGYGELGGVFTSVYLFDLLVRGVGNVGLLPGDRVVVKRTEAAEKDRRVTILGEVRRPGIYRLERGMTLYDLIVRAGGYTPDAYPKGLIFIRESAKQLQQEHIETALATLEESLLRDEEGLALAGASPEEKQALELTLRKQRRLLSLIRTRAKLGLGRIALDVPEDLEKLKDSPSNIPLEDGDYVYVPSRPSYVLVIGGVYNQISLPYVEGKPLSFYLEQVGGLTEEADLENVYVIKANGRVVSKRGYSRPLSFEWRDRKLYFARDFLSMPLEEGDTVVVPTKLRVPTMWRPLVRDITQIIFQTLATAVLAKRL